MTAEQWERQKDFYWGISSDMSPAAVARRINIANGLFRLTRQLSQVGRIAPGPPDEPPETFLARLRRAVDEPAPLYREGGG